MSSDLPIDINQPVRNDEFLEALVRLDNEKSNENLYDFIKKFQAAYFLMACDEEYSTLPQTEPVNGHQLFEKGTKIAFHTTAIGDEYRFLNIFTDWDAINKYNNGRKIRGFIISGDEVVDFIASESSFNGLMINRGSNDFNMTQAFCNEILFTL